MPFSEPKYIPCPNPECIEGLVQVLDEETGFGEWKTCEACNGDAKIWLEPELNDQE